MSPVVSYACSQVVPTVQNFSCIPVLIHWEILCKGTMQKVVSLAKLLFDLQGPSITL